MSPARSIEETRFSLNLGVPNRSSIFAYAIRDLDPLVFAQFLPLRSIPTDFNPASVIEHPDFYDPLLVIGRPLVFECLTLFHCCDVIPPDHDRVAIFLLAAD
jgi:hypothetical protein